ncbi:hypothetical protein BUALT_Bualt14G0132100 [Buddleja alternifolia]|uniref:YTH domain-containing family protein n=1 Tax=Buddleja alternifolia TaxID=168488 RepID=A0AAV6WQP0_9LAMI|nr:hypothetical protein BUALT_Bualt14G0132100 [Buddleja alternifolia]
MEAYNVPDQGLADIYLIQGTESNPQFTVQFEQVKAMYNEGAQDYFVDQGLYYPTNTSYGYICTGIEPTGDWEDHHRVFGLDGQDIQYIGAANESLPYVYYDPNYGYTQSPYNPYNPYIPGAVMGVDGSFVAPQQYYTLPSYENQVSSPAYVPVVLQSRPDTIANTALPLNQVDGLVAKSSFPSNYPNSSQTVAGNASNRKSSFAKVSDGSKTNTGSTKQPVPSMASGSFTSQASSQIHRVRGSQGTENGLNVKASLNNSQLKSGFPFANGSSGFESTEAASVQKVKPKLPYVRVPDDVKVSTDTFSEQNRGPKANKSKNQLTVKAYTTRAGNRDAQGNIIISMDQYNKADFPVDYVNAKFFVIKSYSEDDVHKSIKYSVWSSTPNGNKKLNAAFEDAQRIAAGDSSGCPIFLFFSVNASGQFCGVAEMIGPVDFHRDMDFWQQDKWSGSFPVKWHIIKDLPNPNFRHIILENNENKPVTNSRDTQEIYYKKGLEMLQIYKNYTLKTSLLDDFMYYENRQRILQEERKRLLINRFDNPYLAPLLDPPRKLQSINDFPSIGDVNGSKQDANNLITIMNKNKVSANVDSDCSARNPSGSARHVPLDTTADVGGTHQLSADDLKIKSLVINSEESGLECSLPTTTSNNEVVDVVTIGSMPVKVKGAESSGILTVGTIPLDPRALQGD